MEVRYQHHGYQTFDIRHTGDKGGEAMVGIGSNVDTAGAPVSPLISEPSPLDFRR